MGLVNVGMFFTSVPSAPQDRNESKREIAERGKQHDSEWAFPSKSETLL